LGQYIGNTVIFLVTFFQLCFAVFRGRISATYPVVNLKDLSPITPIGQKQHSIGEAKTDSGISGSEFVLNVFTAIRNRHDPTVRLVNHAI